MATSTLVTGEEYLRRTEKPNGEYVDGVVHLKAMPTKLHSLIQYTLISLLRGLGLDALGEVTVRLSDTKYLVPDVVAAERLQSPYPTEPVLLCVEIFSPDDRPGAMLAKCEQYHEWGVPTCWVIDPERQTAWEYEAGNEPVHRTREEVLRAGKLTVSLEDVFAELPAIRISDHS